MTPEERLAAALGKHLTTYPEAALLNAARNILAADPTIAADLALAAAVEDDRFVEAIHHAEGFRHPHPVAGQCDWHDHEQEAEDIRDRLRQHDEATRSTRKE